MRIVGLTGGIASGKSTVVAGLKAQGLTVIDCDAIAHGVVAKVREEHSCPDARCSVLASSRGCHSRAVTSSSCSRASVTSLRTHRGDGAIGACLLRLGALIPLSSTQPQTKSIGTHSVSWSSQMQRHDGGWMRQRTFL